MELLLGLAVLEVGRDLENYVDVVCRPRFRSSWVGDEKASYRATDEDDLSP